MNIFKALEFFCIFSGMEKQQATDYVPLIASSASVIERKIKDSSLCATDEAAEVAAALSFYRYVLSEEASTGSILSAGSLKSDSSSRVSYARQTYKDTLKMHSHLFFDEDLIFFGVVYEKN